MEIKDTFTVPIGIDEAWQVLLDVERIAPCLPGAKLEESVDDEYRGYVKVKLGAVQQQYKGAATFESVDEAGRVFVLKAEGREARGQGRASALVTGSLAEAGDATEVTIETDLKITGRAAQFGRGVLADVSKNLLAQFAVCLESKLEAEGAKDADSGVESPSAGPGSEGAPVKTAVAPLRPDEEPEPVDLLEVAGAPVAKRAIPAVVGILVVVLIIWWVRRRRHE